MQPYKQRKHGYAWVESRYTPTFLTHSLKGIPLPLTRREVSLTGDRECLEPEHKTSVLSPFSVKLLQSIDVCTKSIHCSRRSRAKRHHKEELCAVNILAIVTVMLLYDFRQRLSVKREQHRAQD